MHNSLREDAEEMQDPSCRRYPSRVHPPAVSQFLTAQAMDTMDGPRPACCRSIYQQGKSRPVWFSLVTLCLSSDHLLVQQAESISRPILSLVSKAHHGDCCATQHTPTSISDGLSPSLDEVCTREGEWMKQEKRARA
jgi:hypothetical protein